MGWFEQNAPQPVAQTPEGTTSGVPLTPSGGGTDYRATFQQLFPGESLSPEQLAANEDKLKAAGFRLLGPNAAGQRSKIELPNGQIVDVIGGAGSGQNRSQWLVENGGGGSGGNLGNFQVGMFTGGGQYPLSSVMGEGLAAPWTTPFNAPDPNSVTNDKALQWQMGRGMDAIQRSAAAKGTLLTGGLLNKLQMQAQGIGSQYYSDVYNRKFNEYKTAHDIFTGNSDTLYQRLFGVAGLGQNAAAQVGNAAGEFGQQAGSTMLGQGNAQASGTAAGGAAYGNAVQNIGNIAASSYQATHQPQFHPYDPGMYQPGTYPAYGNPDYVQGTGNPMGQ